MQRQSVSDYVMTHLRKRIAKWGFEQVHWNELFERTDSMKWVELPIIVVLCVYLEM